MPTGLLDCSGYITALKGEDGEWHTIDLNSTRFVPYEEFPLPKVTETVYHFNDLSNWTFTANMELKMTRAMLKLLYTGRELRRQIRKAEKERRRRLKEGQRGILQERQ